MTVRLERNYEHSDAFVPGQRGGALRRFKKRLASEEWATDDGWKPREGYLYTVVRAISARVNQNYDGWPSEELRKAASTFVGKPCFVNHENHDPAKARGVVVASRFVDAGNDKYIETVMEIDANRFPKLAHEIRTGGLDSVSMGAEAGFTICSYCGNKAQDVPDMCDHVLFHKGEKLSRLNRKTGKREEVLVYESCHKLSFFELSYVFEPADETAVASKVLVASKHVHSAECSPSDPTCNGNVQDTSDPVSGMAGFGNPKSVAEGGGGGSAIGGGELGATPASSGSGGTPNASGILPSSQGLYDTIRQYHDGDIGGYREDSYGEHANGALDVMTSDPAVFERVKTDAFAAGSPYVLWQQQQWNADGTSSKMEDRGSPTQNHMDHVHTAPIGVKASFERKVLRTAGFKVADKCHYCAGDAEEGFKSCAAHRPMEEKKFTKQLEAAVMRYFHGGPPPPAVPQTGIQSTPGMRPEEYVVPFKGRGYVPGTPVAAYRNLHSDVRKQGLWSLKDQNGLVVGHTDFLHMPGGKFFVGEGGNAKVQETGQKNVHAGVRGVLSEVPPDDHGPYTGITYNPKAGDTSFIQRESREPVHAADHVHLGPDGKAYAVNPRSNQTFEARVLRAWGEVEAPASVDTLREEGSAPEDDNNDFYRYVEPPKELQAPDLSEAAQIDREQDQNGQAAMDGQPGEFSPEAGDPAANAAGFGGAPAAPGAPQQQFMELKIPIPAQGQAGAPGAGAIPMQAVPPQAPPPPGPPPGPPQPQQQIAASTLSYMDRYFGHRVSRDAVNLSNLSNAGADSTTSRNPMKGTANMARNTLASRGKVVTAGRRQHFAEGPLVDSGDQSRNDQGEQEEIFLSQTPPADAVVTPKDGEEISNTENNLVARVQKGRAQLLRDAQALANFRNRHAVEEAGGPTASEVDPTVNTGPGGRELAEEPDTISADPNEGVVETQPKDASLHAFKSFDRWLASKTGKPSRLHTSATIRRAADDYSRAAGISVQAMFPALGIVLREARKNEKVAQSKGATMRKRADEKLEVAAPDDRINVEAPTEGTTDAEAQASQFDLHDFGNNAGDNLADPDLSTDQNWAPGEAKQSSKVKTAGGILAFRLAEAMIAAGIEANTAERKYQLAGHFENQNRAMVQSHIALCEKFAAVLQDARRQVASGSTRGAALKAPIPANLGAGQRTAGRQIVANDPKNDSTLFV